MWVNLWTEKKPYLNFMKHKKDLGPHPVVENLRKIMKDRDITQYRMAEYAGVEPSQFSKIMNGSIQISLWQLSNIATCLNMDIIDIFTYPDKYCRREDVSTSDDLKTILSIELKAEMKKKVLSALFNKDDLDILNK